MGKVRRALGRWWGRLERDEQRDGPGPGGGPSSASYDRAHFDAEMSRFRDVGPGSFGGS